MNTPMHKGHAAGGTPHNFDQQMYVQQAAARLMNSQSVDTEYTDDGTSQGTHEEHDGDFEDDLQYWREDIDQQRHAVGQARRENHQRWVESHKATSTQWSYQDSKARAALLLGEAARLEREHLQHQVLAAKEALKAARRNRSIGPLDATPSPPGRRNRGGLGVLNVNTNGSPNSRAGSECVNCGEYSPPRRLPKCGCLHAPIHRQMNYKYRAMNLLRGHFDDAKLEATIEALRQTYPTDADMFEDLKYRYGPEEDEDVAFVDPELRMRCASERLAHVDRKWTDIGAAVRGEMDQRDCFAHVIRNLSIMRIFLEGSQAPQYGCDTSERSRRDAYHQAVLDRLEVDQQLFVTPRRMH